MLLFPYIFHRVPESLLTADVPEQPRDDAGQLGVCLLRERKEMGVVSWQAVFAVEESALPKEVVWTDCGMYKWRIEQYEI